MMVTGNLWVGSTNANSVPARTWPGSKNLTTFVYDTFKNKTLVTRIPAFATIERPGSTMTFKFIRFRFRISARMALRYSDGDGGDSLLYFTPRPPPMST